MIAKVDFIIHRPDLSSVPLPRGDEAPGTPTHPTGSASNPAFRGNGPELWAALHSFALNADELRPADAAEIMQRDNSCREWLGEFAKRLPCGECRAHWVRICTRTPPDFARFFAWTVDRHNEVNAKLGKPGLSIDQARTIWDSPSPPPAAH